MNNYKFIAIVLLGVLAIAIGMFVWAYAAITFHAGINNVADAYIAFLSVCAGAAYVYVGHRIAMYKGNVQ